MTILGMHRGSQKLPNYQIFLMRALHRLLLCRQFLRRILPLWTEKRRERRHSHHYQCDCDRGAYDSKVSPRLIAHRDAPLGREQIQTIGKLPRGRRDSDYVKRFCPWILQFHLDLMEGRVRVSQQVYPAEAHGVRMPADIKKSDRPGPALGRVHEIACPRIVGDVRLAAKPYV